MKLKTKFFLTLVMVMILMSKTISAAIEITDERATPDYWTNKNINGDEIILSEQDISDLNAQIKSQDDYSADLLNLPKKFSAETIKARIKKLTGDLNISSTENINLNTIKDVKVKYAVTTERANLRILPIAWDGDIYDKLQGTAVDPCEPVAVFCESVNKKFVFVQMRNYFGWIEKDQLAFTNRETWKKYIKPENFIVVIDHKKFVNVDNKNILFQMGAVIPIKGDEENFWLAKIPVNEDGKFREVTVKIPKDETIHKGFLPCTSNNFIRQSFKFLGDVYGWGGLQDSVDCSALTSDIYRSMGIEIPRDADRQEDFMPTVARLEGKSFDDKLSILRKSPTGALIFKPGHVMMLLGNDDNGTPIVIHAASSYYLDNKKMYVRKVLVAAMDYPNDYGVSTVEKLTGVTFAK